LQTRLIPDIRKERPDLIGISLTSADQVIAGFTIAALVREAGISAHVVLGGKMIACWREQLPRALALWDLFDSAVYAEGEIALFRLVEELDRRGDLSRVPNLMYRQGHQVRVNESKEPEPTEALPVPDFEGLPWDAYLAPTCVLPVSASRGCYWGRCAFCNVGYGESRHFSEAKAERVADEMIALSQRYDSRHFFFADEALSPRMLRSLSAQLLSRGAELNWTCCARFEPGIRADTLSTMRDAGCRMVLYGLESGSQRILDRMDKGTRLATAERILRDGARAGVWNHIFFFFGFPGETKEDARRTIEFYHRNRDVVHSVCTGTFLLERHAKVAACPDEYGVSRLIAPGTPPGLDHDLAYYYEYETRSGLSAEQAEDIEAQFVQSLPDKPDPQFYIHDVYRFLYASHFGRSDQLPTMSAT